MESREVRVFTEPEGKSVILKGLSDKALDAVKFALAPFNYTFREPNR